MENEKAPPSGNELFEKLREFVNERDIVFVTPKTFDVDSLPNGPYKLPTINEMMADFTLPDGGFRRGELTVFSARRHCYPDYLGLYRQFGSKPNGSSDYKLVLSLEADLPELNKE